MTRGVTPELRTMLEGTLEHRRSAAPGLLATWAEPAERLIRLKEVIAIIRPERWHHTKSRVQRLRLPAFTQQRVLGRGRERGLRYLPRQGASRQTSIQYLPKRMISWIVEDAQVEPLIQALIETNQTGQLGDGKIFVLPIDEAVRLRTGERGRDALHAQVPADIIMGKAQHAVQATELTHASRE